ncbi:MAG: DUF6527 family protein [Minisyncoccia bacterium]
MEHRFVESIPEELEDGILYISPRFRVVIHACCCGCKNKVVTPLSPVRWKMAYDGKTVSLDPSIGNWNFDCKSHYWINNSEVEWAGKWSKEEITRGKMNEKEKREKYYTQMDSLLKKNPQILKQKESLTSKIIGWIKNLFS